MTFDLFYTGLLQGLILSLIALGICLPFRFLDFKDLTCEGAMPLGAVTFSIMMIAKAPVFLAILGAIISGSLCAFITAQVATRLQINSLLAGILVSTCAYSINLKMMGSPNIALLTLEPCTIRFPIVLSLAIGLPTLLFVYLKTDFGLRLRAVGLSPEFCRLNQISINQYTSIGMVISGALFALAGILTVYMQQFVDVGMGSGLIIHGLASLMLGESLIGRATLPQQLASPILGAIIYQQLHGLALTTGIAPSDLKLMTSLFVLIILALKKGENHAP